MLYHAIIKPLVSHRLGVKWFKGLNIVDVYIYRVKYAPRGLQISDAS